MLHLFEGHTDYIIDVAFSPDGKQVVSKANDKAIKVWDLESERLVRTLKAFAWGVKSRGVYPKRASDHFFWGRERHQSMGY